MTQNGQGPEHGGGQPWGGAWGPAGGQAGGQPLPPAQPLPPEAPQGAADAQSTQYLPSMPPQQGPPQPGYGYPGPGAPDMQATQHIAPVPGGMPPVQGAPQPGYGHPGPGAPAAAPQPGYGYPPPAGSSDATQYIAPVPPQQGGGSDTQFLGTGPLAHQGPAAPAGSSDATQYIAPVPAQTPGERQPPAEFDSLFRTEAPRPPQQPHAPQGYQQPGPAPYQQQPPHHQPPQQHAYQDAYYDDDEPEPRRRSPLALIAAVVVGCAVVGLGAGMLLSGGDEEKDPKTPGQNVAASSAAPSTGAPAPTEKPADPAEPQAQELSKLLATSSSSRQTVISSVAAINQCKDLDKAAADLKGAAEQRRGLITRLRALSVDKIPDSAALTAALTQAWQASAAADDHYAAWAGQMKAKKACKGGHARSTSQKAAGDAKSGEASAAKKTAAGLWNPTAAKYGLEKRSWSQL
ncbi:hypothetical protein GCM10010275_32910 [Streptomyces litmocidini]|uniref:hypothetical protein n=1 Tax=Streptomyces litmocidini TaxID=67318 RepID=UPI00198CB300|nr:hypothetical protein [Streptomyces litmocidini]GGU93064.1 hypothetical protein GCM10010275_32910 [Streptomyces litmocidini]